MLSVACAAACASGLAGPGVAGARCGSTADGALAFPRDYAPHSGSRFEYWYWWGHVRDDRGHVLAFELMFNWLTMPGPPAEGTTVDVSVTDLTDGTFHVSTQNIPFLRPTPERDGVRLAGAGQRADSAGGHDVIHLEVDGYVLDLDVRQLRPAVQTFDGSQDVDAFRNYERQRNGLVGTLRRDGHILRVSGEGVVTHAWANSVALLTRSWEWLMLQLRDGRELMAWEFRPYPGGPVEYAAASLRQRDCRLRHLKPSEYRIIPHGTWTRPDGTCSYPASWTFVLGRRRFEVTPAVPDQEVRSATVSGTLNPYWEGLARVSGAGRGWADEEMSGYCRGSGTTTG